MENRPVVLNNVHYFIKNEIKMVRIDYILDTPSTEYTNG